MLPPDWQAMGEAAKLFTRSLMMGLDSAVRKAEFDEPTAEDIENMPYHEAVEYLKKRDVIKKVDYDSLSDKMRFRAFTASRIADGDLLKKLNAEMIASVNDGKGLSDFLSLTKTDILDKIGMGAGSGWYYETVWRTNTQTAFNVGRAMGFAEDKPLALELVIIDDSRTSDICRQYAGKRFILPYDHPFWQTHWPPFHFNCRTTVRAIYDESEIPESWSNPKDIKDANNGFGAYPLSNDSWWEELSSQVARAKEYGLQGEIINAKNVIIGNMTEVENKESTTDTGARSKVLNELTTDDALKLQAESERYYEECRSSNNVELISKIAKNARMDYGDVEKIIKHIFIDEHRFMDGRVERFSPDYRIVKALERLKTGEHTDTDIILLKHELSELTYMRNKKYNVYEVAHRMANKKYNWQEVSEL